MFWAEKDQHSSLISPRVRGPLDISIPKTVQASSGRNDTGLGLRRHAQMVLSMLASREQG